MGAAKEVKVKGLEKESLASSRKALARVGKLELAGKSERQLYPAASGIVKMFPLWS